MWRLLLRPWNVSPWTRKHSTSRTRDSPVGSGAFQERLYPLRYLRRVVSYRMLPDTGYPPAESVECSSSAPVATSISQDLVPPKKPIRLRDRTVAWAAVPKAAVDKHCYTAPVKGQVRCPGQPNAVPELTPNSEPVQR